VGFIARISMISLQNCDWMPD